MRRRGPSKGLFLGQAALLNRWPRACTWRRADETLPLSPHGWRGCCYSGLTPRLARQTTAALTRSLPFLCRCTYALPTSTPHTTRYRYSHHHPQAASPIASSNTLFTTTTPARTTLCRPRRSLALHIAPPIAFQPLHLEFTTRAARATLFKLSSHPRPLLRRLPTHRHVQLH